MTSLAERDKIVKIVIWIVAIVFSASIYVMYGHSVFLGTTDLTSFAIALYGLMAIAAIFIFPVSFLAMKFIEFKASFASLESWLEVSATIAQTGSAIFIPSNFRLFFGIFKMMLTKCSVISGHVIAMKTNSRFLSFSKSGLAILFGFIKTGLAHGFVLGNRARAINAKTKAFVVVIIPFHNDRCSISALLTLCLAFSGRLRAFYTYSLSSFNLNIFFRRRHWHLLPVGLYHKTIAGQV